MVRLVRANLAGLPAWTLRTCKYASRFVCTICADLEKFIYQDFGHYMFFHRRGPIFRGFQPRLHVPASTLQGLYVQYVQTWRRLFTKILVSKCSFTGEGQSSGASSLDFTYLQVHPKVLNNYVLPPSKQYFFNYLQFLISAEVHIPRFLNNYVLPPSKQYSALSGLPLQLQRWRGAYTKVSALQVLL